jgi:GNAT superfamily N-acetyltransferase
MSFIVRWWQLLRTAFVLAGVSAWVPIRPLAPRHEPRILRHLLGLSMQDRYLRFGYAATDEQVQGYVQGLDFRRDEIYGIFNRRLELAAMAHLAYSVDPGFSTCAEFGVSVAAPYRGRKLGSRLFARAVQQARNQGVRMLFIHALTENVAMLRIARHAGARVEREGSESEAFLSLPQATFDSQLGALVGDQMAELDYRFKQQAQQFRQWLATAQEVRRGVRETRHRSGP